MDSVKLDCLSAVSAAPLAPDKVYIVLSLTDFTSQILSWGNKSQGDSDDAREGDSNLDVQFLSWLLQFRGCCL